MNPEASARNARDVSPAASHHDPPAADAAAPATGRVRDAARDAGRTRRITAVRTKDLDAPPHLLYRFCMDDWPDDPAERLDWFLGAPLLPPLTPVWNAPIPSGPRDSLRPRLSLAAAFKPPPRRPAPSFWLAATLPRSAPARLSPLRPSRFRKR